MKRHSSGKTLYGAGPQSCPVGLPKQRMGNENPEKGDDGPNPTVALPRLVPLTDESPKTVRISIHLEHRIRNAMARGRTRAQLVMIPGHLSKAFI